MAVFVRVVEASSFAAAARHFGMSPAMVSKHVQTLEQRLGVRLLNRTTRHVSATEVGQTYYERCQRILTELDATERAVGDQQSAPRGRLRIAAPVSFGMRHLAPAVAEYLARYPDVSIDLNLDDPSVDLLEEGLDLAIRVGRLADSSLIARKLCAAETILCAAPDYLAARGTPQTPDDLAGHHCLVYSYSTPRGVWRFTDSGGGEYTVRIDGRVQANSGDALRELALHGLGIILLPDFIVDDDVRAGRLVRLLGDYTKAETPVHAVYPHGRFLTAKTRSFIDFLAARFGRTTEAPAARPPALRAVS